MALQLWLEDGLVAVHELSATVIAEGIAAVFWQITGRVCVVARPQAVGQAAGDQLLLVTQAYTGQGLVLHDCDEAGLLVLQRLSTAATPPEEQVSVRVCVPLPHAREQAPQTPKTQS